MVISMEWNLSRGWGLGGLYYTLRMVHYLQAIAFDCLHFVRKQLRSQVCPLGTVRQGNQQITSSKVKIINRLFVKNSYNPTFLRNLASQDLLTCMLFSLL